VEQTSRLPGKIDLSTTFGAGLPTGSRAIAGPGEQPYLQFPWSWESGDGWSVNGMMTNFVAPADPVNKPLTETAFVIEREIGWQAFLPRLGPMSFKRGSRQWSSNPSALALHR
jgi:hypothetical protein